MTRDCDLNPSNSSKNRHEVLTFIENYFIAKIGEDKLAAIPSWQLKLLEEGLIDSYGIMELVITLEKQFGTKITDEQINFDNFKSCNALADLLSIKAT